MELTYYQNLPFVAGLIATEDPKVQLESRHKFKRYCLLNQESSDNVIEITHATLNSLEEGQHELGNADAVIVHEYGCNATPQNLLAIATADCLPVFVSSKNCMALVHAGWRGLALGVIEKTLRLMQPKDEVLTGVTVFIGAAAKSCCYEVGPEVLEQLGFGINLPKQKIDLQQIVEKRIRELLPDVRIDTDSRCTVCTENLYSYRRNGTKLRNLSFVII